MHVNVITWNQVDWGILVIILLSTVFSAVRGALRETLSLVSWVLAIVLALKLAPWLDHWLVHSIHDQLVRYGVSVFALFFVSLIVLGLCSRILLYGLRHAGVSHIDHLIGVIFGFLRGLLFVIILLWLGRLAMFSSMSWWQSSYLIPRFYGAVDGLQTVVDHQFSKLRSGMRPS